MRSRTIDVLEFLKDSLTELHFSTGATPKVAVRTAVVVEHSAFIGIVEAAMRSEGGAFADAAEKEFGVTAQANDELVLHFNSALENRQRSDIKLSVEEFENGTVRCLINGEADASNSSYRRLASILNSLLELASLNVETAALVYSDDGLDVDLCSAVWTLLGAHIPTIGLGSIRQLIVAVDTRSLQGGIYYSKSNSVHCVIDERGCHKRKGTLENTQHVGQLSLKCGPDRPIVLFLGAGVSFSSGLPLGNSLRDSALRRMFGGYSGVEAAQLPYEFHKWIRSNNRMLGGEADLQLETFARTLTLERVLREEFHLAYGATRSLTLVEFSDLNTKAAGLPGKAIRELKRIVSKLSRDPSKRLILVTVNFDTLLEQGASDAMRIFRSDEEFAEAPSYLSEYRRNGGLIPYLKLHGSIEDLNTVIASVTQTLSGLSTQKTAAMRSLWGIDVPMPLVYVGCSMRDLDLAPLLSSSEWSEKVDERWVAPVVDENVLRFINEHRQARWIKSEAPLLEVRAITETADNFFIDLAKAWSC